MKRFLIILAVVLALPATGILAQTRWEETPRVGIAVEDSSSASLVNLAAIGAGNASGIGWSGYFRGTGTIDQTVNATLGWLTYNYRLTDSVNNHEIGVGFPLMDGMYLGTGFRWNQKETAGYNIHGLYRPAPWLSLGIKGESLNLKPWMDWGIGFRPLTFSDSWMSRLTLFYDGRATNSGGYENLATGMRISPADGLEIYGHWDFRSEKFVTGVNLSWQRFLLGGEANVAGEKSWQEGSVQAFTSFKNMRSLSARHQVLVVYDVAQIITDTPRLFARAQDLRPDPVEVRSLYEFIMDMEGLIGKPEVEAVLFHNQAFRTSFSNLLEIEQVLRRLKDAGKRIYFYGDTFGSTQYALAASVADEIYMSPRGTLDLTGFGVSNLYFKDLLARYGIKITNLRSHGYKSAWDALSESSMTDEQRESLEYVYAGLQTEMDRMISTGRSGKLTENLDSLYAEGYWMTSARAGQAGLIDDVMYSDQLENRLEERRYLVERFSSSRWDMEYEWKATNRPNIAVIYANGPIGPGEGMVGRNIGAESLADAIRTARNNPGVKAIVLRVNSGGGSALASDIIAREVALCSVGPKRKPMIISMGGTAASGGYMIAAPGARVLATPATITGSIGVITIIPDFSGLLEILDIGNDTITTTESADVPNPYRPLTQEEEQRIRASVMENYDHFVELVALNRNMTVNAVDRSARGRIWTGEQAMNRGLVDEMGTLADAIDLAEDMAGVKDARVLEINPGLMDFLFPGIPPALAVFLDLQPADPLKSVPEDIRDVIEFYRSVSEYQRGEALYLMPYTLEELNLDSRD